MNDAVDDKSLAMDVASPSDSVRGRAVCVWDAELSPSSASTAHIDL